MTVMTEYANLRGVVLFVVLTAAASVRADSLWEDMGSVAAKDSSGRQHVPHPWRADLATLRAVLAQAPLEGTSSEGAEMELPMPDGGVQRFGVELSPIMAPALAAAYPEVRTYRARGLDDPTATARLDITPQGFHAMVTGRDGIVYVDPTAVEGEYRSYFRHDYLAAKGLEDGGRPPFCGVAYDAARLLARTAPAAKSAARSGELRYTYRLAVAATGEYTQFHGGKSAAQAAIITAINRVNEIFERDLTIRLELIAGNDTLVFTDSSTDPYTNSDPSAMLTQNQGEVDSRIGSSNYDVAHVFATDGGGLAQVGAVCASSLKAQGVSGHPSPSGDAFYIDYVAHEIGHQFGAEHTFNSTSGSCNGNRVADTAYEPGSGSTIMAYPGLCGTANIASAADAIFHAGSIEQILHYVTNGTGANCPVTGATGNTPPTVSAGDDYNIPISTPFMLTGSATDPDSGQTLTYQWDEMDAGTETTSTTFGTDLGDNALFRSYLPASTASRVFPRMFDLAANVSNGGEVLPTTYRDLKFRLTARDGVGGVGEDDMQLAVTTLAGPFTVMAPNTGVTLDNRSAQLITWDVANTASAPVNCAQVDILLSTNGGAEFNTTLVADTANDGAQSATLPAVDTNTARIMVKCSDNVFFDISDVNFRIATGSGEVLGSAGVSLGATTLSLAEGETATVSVVLTAPPTSNVRLVIEGAEPNLVDVSPTALLFTTGDWDTAQTITLSGATDSDRQDNAVAITVRVDDGVSDDAYDGVADQTLVATLQEPDGAGVVTGGAGGSAAGGGGGSAGTLLALLLGWMGLIGVRRRYPRVS